jgi:hypothetical protein
VPTSITRCLEIQNAGGMWNFMLPLIYRPPY